MRKTTFLLSLLVLASPCFLSAQHLSPVQTVRGIVFDKDTRQPLIGATVQVMDLPVSLGTTTEMDGSFTIPDVPVGRISIGCSYIGYAPWRADGLVLTAARELLLEIELKEDAVSLGEIVVQAISAPHGPLNDAALLSARSFSVEEVQHFAGAINDPGRMAHSLPGVQPSKDNEGDLIVRGNASSGVLWRLEGVDILNPNHFARLGGSGGRLTIFSVSVLGTSDFFAGAFPAEYGNALSAVFDMRFRNGNRERRQHRFRAGMLGLEAATEGPFGGSGSKGSGGSYLLNYRYSTLGILNELGIYLVGPRVRNNFQDLSFNLFFPSKNGKSSIRVWGAGGMSFEEKIVEERAWLVFDDSLSYESGSDVGVIGLTHNLTTSEKSHLKTTVAVMGQRAFLTRWRNDSEGSQQTLNDENYVQGRVAISTFFTQKISARTTFKAGLQAGQHLYDLRYDSVQAGGNLGRLIGENGGTVQVQPFAQLSLRPNVHWTVNAGLHAMYFGLTRSFSLEPRLSARRSVGERQSVSLAIGLHRQTVPIGAYFINVTENNVTSRPNLNLDLMTSAQAVLAYDVLLTKQLRLHAEAYIQRLSGLPVDFGNGRAFLLLNEIEGYPARRFRSEGKGLNTGLDVSLEKFFRQGLFFILNGSLFESRYGKENATQYNTQFNARYMASFTAGREWFFQNGSALQLGLKNLYVNGLPTTPLAADQPFGERPLFVEGRPYSGRIADYFRTDLRIAWRKSRHILSLDVQNVFNIKNKRPFGWEFGRDAMQWALRDQAGIVPVLGYSVDF